MAIRICKERAVIVNFNERQDGSVFLVFMIPNNGFLKGELKPELMARMGQITRFYWADIEFVDSDDEDATLEILSLSMDQPAQTGPAAF